VEIDSHQRVETANKKIMPNKSPNPNKNPWSKIWHGNAFKLDTNY